MVVTRDLELQYRETKEVRKIRMIDMDGGITIAGQENQNQRKYEEEKGDPLNHQSIFSGKGVTFELRMKVLQGSQDY
ncbi:hypothetical protein HA466_0008060 [Hirschfeldia incana]|nr:hypothetical protein HA466_0008060 [Hirschfeldia incana]